MSSTGSDDNLRYSLSFFERAMEDHENALQIVENTLATHTSSEEELASALRKIRKARVTLKKELRDILRSLPEAREKELKDDVMGLLSYLYEVGLATEMELLEKARTIVNKDSLLINEIYQDEQDLQSLIQLIQRYNH